MSLGHNCRFGSSQCDNREIMEILMNILASFFVLPLFCALNFYFGSFHQNFGEIFFKLCYFFWNRKFMKHLTKTAAFQFFSVAKIEYVIIDSNWMHEIMTGQKKKTKIFIRISVISRILHWLDCNQKL